MSERDHHDERSPDHMTNAAFTDELERLVARARDAGVDLEGAYNVRTPQGSQSDYTIEIAEITKRPDHFRVESVE